MEKNVAFYIVDAKIQKQRLKDMKYAATKRQITVLDQFRYNDNHLHVCRD